MLIIGYILNSFSVLAKTNNKSTARIRPTPTPTPSPNVVFSTLSEYGLSQCAGPLATGLSFSVWAGYTIPTLTCLDWFTVFGTKGQVDLKEEAASERAAVLSITERSGGTKQPIQIYMPDGTLVGEFNRDNVAWRAYAFGFLNNGPWYKSGSGAPFPAFCTNGSIYSRTDTNTEAYVYFCENGVWVAK